MRRPRPHTLIAILACLAGAPLTPAVVRGEPAPDASGPDAPGRDAGSCIRCHADPDFVSTHPRLYEYYRDWERSIHGQEGVTCSDCHGGDPEAADARRAHAEFLGADEGESAVGFARVHETCGVCHDEIADAYRRSTHYEKLRREERGRHGPTCVTCHRAMNTLTLDVTTVEAACARCHDERTGIDPEVPGRARTALNKFLSIDRFRRYVAARMEPEKAGPFLRRIDARVESLSVLWHTFDLERIREETEAVLDTMKAKRDEIRGGPPDGEARGADRASR